jgi:ADP-ribose pyrophosphatase YjhB (NUDIX family)
MAQRYRVFVDQKVIEFSENINNLAVDDTTLVSSYSSLTQLSELFIDFLHCNDKSSLIVITSEKFDEATRAFRHLFHKVKAAGGIVRNEKNDYLFIKRHGIWDLPKGKIEKGENRETGALREVNEETGLQNLEITSLPLTTYHIYNDKKGSFILKETFWYEMLYTGNETPVPQLEEDITEVRWFKMSEINEVSSNTYLSLKEMLTGYFASKNARTLFSD